MATNLQRAVRRAILAKLKADTGLTDLVPAASIRSQGEEDEPVWPHILLAAPVTRPFRASCTRGGTVALDIHAFARARKADDAVVETAEDHAGRIGGAIERILNWNRLTLDTGTASTSLSDIRLIPDAEPGAFHWFAQINARVLAS